VALVVSLLPRSLLRHHMFDLNCRRRNGTANFGCSAGTPAPGTAADRCGTSTRARSAVLLVELPGIEPGGLPGLLPFELRFRSVSVRFSPVRYLRFARSMRGTVRRPRARTVHRTHPSPSLRTTSAIVSTSALPVCEPTSPARDAVSRGGSPTSNTTTWSTLARFRVDAHTHCVRRMAHAQVSRRRGSRAGLVIAYRAAR
jgi:hypothetical protein